MVDGPPGMRQSPVQQLAVEEYVLWCGSATAHPLPMEGESVQGSHPKLTVVVTAHVSSNYKVCICSIVHSYLTDIHTHCKKWLVLPSFD